MNEELEQDLLGEIAPEKVCTKRNTNGCCGCTNSNRKLSTYDWLYDFPELQNSTDLVEVQFKNTRKGYFLNSNHIELKQGDTIAVEATPGHDIGTVTLTGKLVTIQMKKDTHRIDKDGIKRVYRLARPSDIEKYEKAKSFEEPTMIRARQIAEELDLQMKIGDVEYQGDGNKAIFYYIADDRVDFRQLIKELANEFHVKIEMRQIGARQEAGRIGGIGPCGRELCCSSWMTSFVSVSTSAARYQDLSINPQKLAGQCGKLKCCMNYEVDAYLEAQRELPSREVVLQTKDSEFYHFKTDVFSGEITYSSNKHIPSNLITISKERVFEIIAMNKKGKRPITLSPEIVKDESQPVGGDILMGESLTRFDKQNEKTGNRRKSRNKKKPQVKEEENDNQEIQVIKPILNVKSNDSESEPKKNKNRRNNQQKRRKRPSNNNNDAKDIKE